MQQDLDHLFVDRYGPWAVVAGASQGIGASFARKLAARSLNLVLVARRASLLEELAGELRRQYGVQVEGRAFDLGAPDLVSRMEEVTQGLDVGLIVYNAAMPLIGAFLDQSLDDHSRVIDVNVRGPLLLSHYFGNRFAKRGRGGIILMTSMGGIRGTSMIANYAATKAYGTVLAEGLWYELRRDNVDVLACVAGATRTPNYESSTDRIPSNWLARPMEADDVTEQALRDLGREPAGVSGRRNRFAAVLLGRLLPRRLGIRMVSKATEQMYR